MKNSYSRTQIKAGFWVSGGAGSMFSAGNMKNVLVFLYWVWLFHTLLKKKNLRLRKQTRVCVLYLNSEELFHSELGNQRMNRDNVRKHQLIIHQRCSGNACKKSSSVFLWTVPVGLVWVSHGQNMLLFLLPVCWQKTSFRSRISSRLFFSAVNLKSGIFFHRFHSSVEFKAGGVWLWFKVQ